jgi:UDPglucose 6-dehydrogenase
MEINTEQKARFLRKVREALWNVRGKKLAVLGLAFKGGTDDVRDSPAIDIVSDLLFAGASIAAFDPAAMARAEAFLPKAPGLSFVGSAYEACTDADAVLVLTEWREFYDLDLVRIRKLLRLPILLDGKNIFDPVHAQVAGLHYFGIGTSSTRPRKNGEVGILQQISRQNSAGERVELA